jgi:hypothetical protein
MSRKSVPNIAQTYTDKSAIVAAVFEQMGQILFQTIKKAFACA